MSTSTHAQAPGFQRFSIGGRTITALYDGFVPIFADDLHGAGAEEIAALLTGSFLPAEGDLHTAVTVFLVDLGSRTVLVDAGSGTSLGPDVGHVLTNLRAAGRRPEEIDDVLLTHLHPDHVHGLLRPDGGAAYPRARVHVAQADVRHWLDPAVAEAATDDVQKQIHEWARAALAPYDAGGRLRTFEYGTEPVPGILAVDQHGHTPGHTGYLLGGGDEAVLFWGDTMHSHSVQLVRPEVSIAIDSDEGQAVRTRRDVLDRVVEQRCWVGAAHLPFPGIGRLRRGSGDYVWVPASYRPLPPVAEG
ncbi:MBL fold metallo-hydrolase [Pseudonocardia sp.]|uniref:MBL fold metallo-hydrolase n=1 Tax=Pseudonocardia sp. TaxID=60912 RepID=UPI003D1109D6